jgi:outer membrane protein assembly factor BamB
VPSAALPGTHYITAIGRHTGDAAQAAFTVSTNWPKFAGGVHNQSLNAYENVLSPSMVSGLDVLWTAPTGSLVQSSPAYFSGRLYVGSRDYKLYALNATTGAVLWATTTGNIVSSSPAVANARFMSDRKMASFGPIMQRPARRCGSLVQAVR